MSRAAYEFGITGSGAATALGFSLADMRAPLAAGTSGIRAAEAGGAPLSTHIAPVEPPYLRAEVPAELENELRFLNPSGRLSLNPVAEALAGAEAKGLDLGSLEAARKSVYLAQVDAADWDCHDFQQGFLACGDDPLGDMPALNKQSSRRTKPTFLLESLKNNVYSFVAKWISAMGPNTGFAGLSHSGFHALDAALRTLARGQIDAALVVGSSVLAQPVARLEFGGSPREGGAVVPGDGAGAILLEPLAALAARGETPLGVVRGAAAGTGPATDGAPQADTVRYVAEAALQQAGVSACDVIVVPALDGPVHQALADLPALAQGRAVSFRAATGHIGAATETVELALACEALAEGETALLLSAGFYGLAGALVLTR